MSDQDIINSYLEANDLQALPREQVALMEKQIELLKERVNLLEAHISQAEEIKILKQKIDAVS